MNSFTIFFVVCIAFACAAALPPQGRNKKPGYHAPLAVEPEADAPVAAKEGAREKRFFPLAYSAPISTVSGYSYLAPYANSGKIVHYPAPVVSSYAAVPAVSTYAAYPAISAYAAAPWSAGYHALY